MSPPPLHLADHRRIAGGRLLARVEGARQKHGIAIDPVDRLLGSGNRKSTRNESTCLDVEFADLDGIAPAIRKVHQAARIVRRQALDPLQEPLAPLLLRQRIEVQQRGPGRLARAIGHQRRMPPDTLGVACILPEIIDATGPEGRHRDPVLRREDGQRFLLVGIIPRITGQPLERTRILPLNP